MRLGGKTLKQGWSHDAQLEAFVAYAPVAIAMFDLDMRYVATSERWLSDYGLDRSPVGLLHYDVFPEIPASWKATHRRCLEGATESSEGDPFRRADGRVQWVKWSASPWRRDRGAIGGIIVTTEDVTTHKEAEAEAERLASIVRHSSDAILAKTLESIVTDWNPAATRLFGYSAEEMIGRSIVRIIPADRLAEESRILERIRAGEVFEAYETQRVARDGSVLDVSLSIAPVRDAMGAIVGDSTILRDITQRRKAEDALRTSEERFRALVEDAPDAILLFDMDKGVYVAANKAVERLFGVSREELLGQNPHLLPAPDQVPHSVSVLQRFYAPEQPDGMPLAQSFREYSQRALAGEEVTFERRIRRPSGEDRIARATVVRLPPSRARLIRISLVDITEQSRAQRELASTAAILETEHQSSPDGILVVDTTGSVRVARILSVNRRLAEIFGIPDDVLAARDYPAIRSRISQQVSDPEAFVRRVQHLIEHPDQTFHDELLLKDGRVIDRLSAPFRTSDGVTMGRITFFRDITARRRAEDALRASEERFRTLIEEAPDAILLFDVDQGRLVAANKSAERLFGASRDEIARRGPQNFYAPEQPDGRPLGESLADHNGRALAGEDVTFERRIRRPSGEDRICRVRLVRLSSTSRLLRSSLVDITDQRAAEAQLSEVLRGTVALQEAERRRIARELHDSLNQYLAALTMKLAVFRGSVAESSPLTAGIAELQSLTGTVQDEVNRLAFELHPIALDDIGIEPAIKQLITEWAERSGLRMDVDAALKGRRLPLQVETTLYRVLQEGVRNIVRHAEAKQVGVILKSTPDSVVMIIEDDGKGFDPETVNRGSSPNFGLLGMRERLALVGGSLEIETGPGAGTTLIVRAPLDLSAPPP